MYNKNCTCINISPGNRQIHGKLNKCLNTLYLFVANNGKIDKILLVKDFSLWQRETHQDTHLLVASESGVLGAVGVFKMSSVPLSFVIIFASQTLSSKNLKWGKY